jgi:hypothetical protein
LPPQGARQTHPFQGLTQYHPLWGWILYSNQVEKNLTADEKRLYLTDIKKDITYFRKPYERADLRVDISGLDYKQAALCVKEAVEALERSRKKEQKTDRNRLSRLGNSRPSSQRLST